MKKNWRCGQCGTLLGVEDGDSLILRYKEVEYIIDDGHVTAICRNCRRASVINISKQLVTR